MTEESSELQSKGSQSQTRLKRLSIAAQASKWNASKLRLEKQLNNRTSSLTKFVLLTNHANVPWSQRENEMCG